MAKVEVRPLEVKKWHGKKDKENFSRPKAVEVLYDEETGRYATGLSKAEADEYGTKLNVDLSDTFNGQAHPYWSQKTSWVLLPNHTLVLDTDRASDFVKIKNLKASKFVANSMTEYQNGRWPFATHVIYDEDEEVNMKAKLIQDKRKASEILLKMDKDAKIAIILVIDGKNLRGRSDNFIDVAMENILDTKPNEFLKWAIMGREKVTLRSVVLEALQKNVLTKDPSGISYMGDIIGYGVDEVMDYLEKPEHNLVKVKILEHINK